MAKKKSGRQFLESAEERIISDEFDRAVKFIRRQAIKGDAAKYYDLHGKVLHRRKAAAIAYMEQIKERYTQKHRDLDIAVEWAFHSSVSAQTIVQLDLENHITLAAAIWMLDELKHSGHLKDAFKYFYKDIDNLETFFLPDYFDAWHDDLVIRSMIHLIRHRDCCEKPERHYINDITAARTTPINYAEFQATDQHNTVDPDLGPRERFSAIMAMIHPEVRKRAVDRFVGKQWDFLDGLFSCGEIYSAAEKKANLESERLLKQGQQLQKMLNVEQNNSAERANRPPFPTAISKLPQLPSFPSLTATGVSAFSYETDRDDIFTNLMRVAEKGLALQIKADDLNRKHADLLFMSPLAPLYGRKALERDLLPEIVDRLLSFEVNDPYETCFAFLCLVDEGSDAAWLYNTNLAVLSAAARKLPWADNIFTPEDYDEWDDTDEVHPDSEYKADSPHDPVELSNVPIDWNNKKTRLYELKYKDDVAFFPDKSDRKDWKLNIPQMVYSLTDLVMPRTVSDYDEFASKFVEAGMDPAAAAILELYLQLAFDIQYPSKDWSAFLQSSRFQQISERYGGDAPAPEKDNEDTVDVTALHEQIRALKEQNGTLRQAIYTATKEVDRQKNETKRILDESANEHQELLDLRELIYNQANDQDDPETEVEDRSVELPYNTTRRTVVFGGHDTWLKAIKPLLPNVVFVNRGQTPNAEMIRGADTIWIQANALSHKNYYKIINNIRTYRIPVRYFGYASARKCAEQLVREDMKA